MNSAINTVGLRSIYPSATGMSVAQNATGPATVPNGSPQVAAADANPAAQDPVSFASAVGQSGNVVVSGIVLLALVFGVMMLSEKFGGDGNQSIKATFFNVMIIGLAASVGTPIWKYLAVKFPIPGVSSWILAG